MIEKTFPLSIQLLANGLKLTQQLLQLLIEEEATLKIAKASDKINNLAEQKQGVVLQLNQFTKQLDKVLATEKLTSGPEAIENYFKIAQTAGFDIAEAANNWAKLTSLTKQCRDLNDQNGACLAILSRHTQRSLNILKGQSQSANTYSPDGLTASDISSQTMISV